MPSHLPRIPEQFGYDWLLESYRPLLTINVPVFSDRCTCLFLSKDAPQNLGVRGRAAAKKVVEKDYAHRTQAHSAFPSVKEFNERILNSAVLPADLYFCHGSISHGSGRSVLFGGYQIKGVGRTQAAGIHDFYKDICGSQGLFDAWLEVAFSTLLDCLLLNGAFRGDFIAALGPRPERFPIFPDRADSWDLRCVLGRRGSPIRRTHIEYLHGKLLRYSKSLQRETWHRVVTQLVTTRVNAKPVKDVRVLVKGLLTLLERAMILCVESRLYSLELCYWGDNHDIYSRIFDSADTRSKFPNIDLWTNNDPGDRRRRPIDCLRAESPKPHSTIYDRGQIPLENTLASLDLIFRALGLESAEIDRLLSWDRLERLYTATLPMVIHRLFAQSELGLTPAARREAVTRTVRILKPLVPFHRMKGDPKTSAKELDLLAVLSRATGLKIKDPVSLGGPGLFGSGGVERYRAALKKDLREKFVYPLERGKRPTPWNEDQMLDVLRSFVTSAPPVSAPSKPRSGARA